MLLPECICECYGYVLHGEWLIRLLSSWEFVTSLNFEWKFITGKKKFHWPMAISRWVMVVYEREQRFNRQAAQGVIRGLLDAFNAAGESSYLLLLLVLFSFLD